MNESRFIRICATDVEEALVFSMISFRDLNVASKL